MQKRGVYAAKPRLIPAISALGLLSLCLAGSSWLAGDLRGLQDHRRRRTGSASAQYPPLFFREDWKLAGGLGNINTPQEPEHVLFQGDVANPIWKCACTATRPALSPSGSPTTSLTYVMTLLCMSNCAVTLRDKNNDVDLSGLATIRWRTKVSGFHLLHPIVKLADGTWLVGDHATALSSDWVESQIQLADVRWQLLNIQDVIEARGYKWIDTPNLSRVEEIGFTEMMRGGGHGAPGSRIDWIEVYGKPVPRAASGATTSRR